MVFEFIGQSIIENSLELEITTILTIIVFVGGLIIFAKDYTMGLLLQFFIQLMLFVGFYLLGWAYQLPLIISLMTLVILSLSLYATSKKVQLGGII